LWHTQQTKIKYKESKKIMRTLHALQKVGVVILLIGLLVGCGTSETASSTATSFDAASNTSKASAPTATLAPTATSVPLTATATAIPPTAAATPIPPTPTAEATPETVEEAPAETTDSGELETQGSGACAHPFFPLRDDRLWTYRTFAEGMPSSQYTQSYADVSSEGFTNIMQLEGVSIEAKWLCSDEGILTNDYSSIAATSVQDFTYETLDYSGVYLLPAEQWEVGAAWESTYTVRAVVTVESMTVENDMIIAMQNQIVAIEDIIVPAGTYQEAYRVDTNTTLNITSNGFTSEMTLPSSQWFVRGVGLVKTVSTFEGMTSGVELLSLEEK
jgi:hypothetical protein